MNFRGNYFEDAQQVAFLQSHVQGSQYELKDSPGSHPASLPVHAAQGFYPYGQYPYGDPSRAKTATRETTSTLKAWLQEHQKNPYPTKGEKIMLAIITRMTLTQVSAWCVGVSAVTGRVTGLEERTRCHFLVRNMSLFSFSKGRGHTCHLQ